MRIKKAFLTAAVLLATATVGRASTFTFTYSGLEAGSFQLSSAATPDDSQAGFYSTFFVTSTQPGVTAIFFYPTGNGGGFASNLDGNGYYGSQVYTGTEAAPVFVPGTYLLSFDDTGTLDETLVISETPEPSSFALLLTGVAGAAGMARRKGWLTRIAA